MRRNLKYNSRDRERHYLPGKLVAIEDSKEGLSKLLVHEAVGDWIATGADVGQQLDQGDTGASDVLVDLSLIHI